MANMEREVLIDAPDQPIVACGFIFAYAAKRKIPASANRPASSSNHPIDPRVFVVIEIFSLLAQQRIEELLEDRVGYYSRRGRVFLALINDNECRRSLHRYGISEPDVLHDEGVNATTWFGFGYGAICFRFRTRNSAGLQYRLHAFEIRRAHRRRNELFNIAVRGPCALVVPKRSIDVLKFPDLGSRVCPSRRLRRIWMHLQWEVAVN